MRSLALFRLIFPWRLNRIEVSVELNLALERGPMVAYEPQLDRGRGIREPALTPESTLRVRDVCQVEIDRSTLLDSLLNNARREVLPSHSFRLVEVNESVESEEA